MGDSLYPDPAQKTRERDTDQLKGSGVRLTPTLDAAASFFSSPGLRSSLCVTATGPHDRVLSPWQGIWQIPALRSRPALDLLRRPWVLLWTVLVGLLVRWRSPRRLLAQASSSNNVEEAPQRAASGPPLAEHEAAALADDGTLASPAPLKEGPAEAPGAASAALPAGVEGARGASPMPGPSVQVPPATSAPCDEVPAELRAACTGFVNVYRSILKGETVDADGTRRPTCLPLCKVVADHWPAGEETVGHAYADFCARELRKAGWLTREKLRLVGHKSKVYVYRTVRPEDRPQDRSSHDPPRRDRSHRDHAAADRSPPIRRAPHPGAPGIARPDPEDLDKSLLESREPVHAPPEAARPRITAATEGFLPEPDHHLRCNLRRAAGLRIPQKIADGGDIPLTEAQLRDYEAYPDKNRAGDTIAWLFPDRVRMDAALLQIDTLRQKREAEEARRQALAAETAQREARRTATRPAPTPEAKNVWDRVLGRLQDRLADHHVELWLRPLSLLSVSSGQALLLAPNRFIRDWVMQHLPVVAEELGTVLGTPPRIAWCTDFEDDDETGEAAQA